jgi:hypothetical protein
MRFKGFESLYLSAIHVSLTGSRFAERRRRIIVVVAVPRRVAVVQPHCLEIDERRGSAIDKLDTVVTFSRSYLNNDSATPA